MLDFLGFFILGKNYKNSSLKFFFIKKKLLLWRNFLGLSYRRPIFLQLGMFKNKFSLYGFSEIRSKKLKKSV